MCFSEAVLTTELDEGKGSSFIGRGATGLASYFAVAWNEPLEIFSIFAVCSCLFTDWILTCLESLSVTSFRRFESGG